MTPEAFSAFYTNTARGLWTYLYRVTANAADADDLLQEAFCRLLGSQPELADEKQARRYVYRIASNLLVDRWRARGQAATEPIHDESVVAASPAPSDSDAWRVLARLPVRDRALVWLAHVEGHTHDELAREFGLAPGSVRVLLFRARQRLRELLNKR